MMKQIELHSRKILRFFAMLTMLMFFGSQGAQSGPGITGGGSEIVVDFLTRADCLLQNSKINWTDEDKHLLSETLKVVKITTNHPLIDFDTGKILKNQRKLIAWATIGRIQLKMNPDWGHKFDDSWENTYRSNKIFSHHIIHELFRASGAMNAQGISIDDAYQRSVLQYGLDKIDSTCSKRLRDGE